MLPTRALRRSGILRSATLRSAILTALLLTGLSPAGRALAQEETPAEPEVAPQRPAPRAGSGPKPAPAKTAPPRPAPAAEAPKPAAAAAVWPAGASSVSESYGDWTMTCNRAEERTACLVMQSQGDNKTGRRQFAIEFRAPRDGRSEGLILMPFGLAIEPGVMFKLDEAVLGKGAPYVSCSGDGCLVPISFPALATDGMKTAKTLVVVGRKAGADEPVAITVPLAGFSAAFDRAAAFGG